MNYYVMDANSVLLHRSTLDGCRAWAQALVKQFRDFGMTAPTYRIFYDSGTEPLETVGQSMNAKNQTPTRA